MGDIRDDSSGSDLAAVEQAHAWNEHSYPDIVDSCVHELIEKRALQTPDAPAIRAWDRELSYAELNSARPG